MPVNSVEDVLNQALRAGGVAKRIESVYEGSDAAKVALELYSQARDELLDLDDWSFSRRTTPLSLLKGPPPVGGYNYAQPWSNLYPAPGFLYEYAYPSDCIDLRAIIQQPGPMPDLDPLPALWRVDDDPAPNIVDGAAVGPPQKVIYCNTTAALAIYRARITNPALWDAGFVAALVSTLGARFAKAFGQDAQSAQQDMANAANEKQTVTDLRG